LHSFQWLPILCNISSFDRPENRRWGGGGFENPVLPGFGFESIEIGIRGLIRRPKPTVHNGRQRNGIGLGWSIVRFLFDDFSPWADDDLEFLAGPKWFASMGTSIFARLTGRHFHPVVRLEDCTDEFDFGLRVGWTLKG